MKLRGWLTVATIGAVVTVSDVTQRVVIATFVKVFPSRRQAVLAWWQRCMARAMVGSVRIVGGGTFRPLPTIPSESGILVLMNHQSLLDIPLANLMFEDGCPCIVTRKRYARGVPLISHMTRLYGYPLVDPNAPVKTHVKMLRNVARTSESPVLVYPEGTRSRNGELLPFRKGALNILLRHRTWKVYLAVADGVLPCGELATMLRGVDAVDCQVRVIGPFDTPEDAGDIPAWSEEMQNHMREGLRALRAATSP